MAKKNRKAKKQGNSQQQPRTNNPVEGKASDKVDYMKLRRSAYELIVEQGKTQKEAAQLLGVTEKTMSDWAVEGHWRELRKTRQSAASTARENIQRIVNLLSDKRINLEYSINEAIDAGDKEQELLLRKEADKISVDMRMQRKNIEGMNKEKDITLGIYVDVMDSVFSALRAHNPDVFDQTLDFQTLHLRKISNELG